MEFHMAWTELDVTDTSELLKRFNLDVEPHKMKNALEAAIGIRSDSVPKFLALVEVMNRIRDIAMDIRGASLGHYTIVGDAVGELKEAEVDFSTWMIETKTGRLRSEALLPFYRKRIEAILAEDHRNAAEQGAKELWERLRQSLDSHDH
jgi:hypothetical protein